MNTRYPKIDPEFKAKWVPALRSGKYKQGRGSLVCDEKYCCLGVAGVVSGLKAEDMDGFVDFNGDELGLETTLVPSELRHAALSHELICMNDSEDKTFEEIADWIEENL
jgi:hypothetical protein